MSSDDDSSLFDLFLPLSDDEELVRHETLFQRRPIDSGDLFSSYHSSDGNNSDSTWDDDDDDDNDRIDKCNIQRNRSTINNNTSNSTWNVTLRSRIVATKEKNEDSSSEEEDEEIDFNDVDNEGKDDDEVSEDEEADKKIANRSLHNLVSSFRLGLAFRKFRILQKDGDADALHKACLEKTTCPLTRKPKHIIHSLLTYRYQSTPHATQLALTRKILQFTKQYPEEHRKMLSERTDYYKETALHTTLRGIPDGDILRKIIVGYPEAMFLQNNRRQTPLETHLKRRDKAASPKQFNKSLKLVTGMMRSWNQYQVQISTHLCCQHYLAPSLLDNSKKTKSASPAPSSSSSSSKEDMDAIMTPFSDADRRVADLAPDDWFALSTIGYCFQHKMESLAVNILQYVGGGVPTIPYKQKDLRRLELQAKAAARKAARRERKLKRKRKFVKRKLTNGDDKDNNKRKSIDLESQRNSAQQCLEYLVRSSPSSDFGF